MVLSGDKGEEESRHQESIYWLCNLLRRYLFFCAHYPAFTREFIAKKIDRPSTRSSELRAYHESCNYSHLRRAICILILYASYSLKNLYFVYESLRVYDYEHFESNLKGETMPDQSVSSQYFERAAANDFAGPSSSATPSMPNSFKTFSCLTTNCTHLNELPASGRPAEPSSAPVPLVDRLAEDLSKLPIFMLCHPALDALYSPVSTLDTFGILAFLVSMFTVFLLGCWATLQQLISPASNELIMFLVAPQVTARLVRERILEFLSDLAISYENYRIYSMWKRAPVSGALRTSSVPLGEREMLLPTRNVAREHQVQSPCSWSLSQRFIRLPPRARTTTRTLVGSVVPRPPPESVSSTNDDDDDDLHPDRLAGRLTRSRKPFWLPPGHSLAQGQKASDEPERQVERRHLASASVDNCMPIVRGEWWRQQLARIFLRAFALSAIGICLTGALVLAYIEHRLAQKRSLLGEYARVACASNCFIWNNDQLRAEQTEPPAQAGPPPDNWDANEPRLDRLAPTKPATRNSPPIPHRLVYDPSQAIQIDQLELSWSWYGLAEAVCLNYAAGFSLTVLLAYYWAIMCELSVWLAELRLFILASLLVVRVRNERLVVPSSSGGPPPNKLELPHSRHVRSFHQIPNLARHFRDSIFSATLMLARFDLSQPAYRPECGCAACGRGPAHTRVQPERPRRRAYKYNLINSKSNDRYHLKSLQRQLAGPRVCAGCAARQQSEGAAHCLDFDIETLEQIYVGFRLFVEYVHSLRPTMNIVLAMTYLLNYGYVLMAVVSRRKLANLSGEPTFIIVFGFSFANYLIFVSANFHANAKKLQPLLWSTIAQLTRSRDLRVKHLRSLWLKQVKNLDIEGGLALKALGMRVTYVYIIQLMVWTATILVIALKQS